MASGLTTPPWHRPRRTRTRRIHRSKRGRGVTETYSRSMTRTMCPLRMTMTRRNSPVPARAAAVPRAPTVDWAPRAAVDHGLHDVLERELFKCHTIVHDQLKIWRIVGRILRVSWKRYKPLWTERMMRRTNRMDITRLRLRLQWRHSANSYPIWRNHKPGSRSTGPAMLKKNRDDGGRASLPEATAAAMAAANLQHNNVALTEW